LFFALATRPGLLSASNQRKIAIDGFKASVRADEFALALQIWSLKNNVIKENVSLVLESLVTSFESSPGLIFFKSYFLFLVLSKMTYEHVDRVLKVMEERFRDVEEDGNDHFLMTNLNPI